jgi:branched-chain amino acid aminotransferase
MTGAIWVNETVCAPEAASVAALDRGFLVGDGVFETLLVRDGVPFAMTRHLRRFRRSAAVLELPVPPSDVLGEAVARTLAAAGPLPLGRMRITLSGGVGPLGTRRGDTSPTLVVAAMPLNPWPDVIRVVSLPWPRNERSPVAGAKTTSYADNVVAMLEVGRRGADEGLVPNTRGELCEGTGSNVVLVLDGALVTPPLSSGCLGGISRELLLEWAAEEDLGIREEPVPFDSVGRAEAVLLTSSTRNVQPASFLDGRRLEQTTLGRAAVELFSRRAANVLDP